MLQSPLMPLVFGLAFLAVSGARAFWLRRTTGINAYAIDHNDPLHRLVAYIFFGVAAGLLLYFSAIAVSPILESNAGRLEWAINGGTRSISFALMALAIVWTAYAQVRMGTSWRIGIPADRPPQLRTHGPFAMSRNPIFLGMLIFVAAMTLWSPSAVTIALLAATYIALEVQVRSEEMFLENAHGEAYRAYRLRVRRWL